MMMAKISIDIVMPKPSPTLWAVVERFERVLRSRGTMGKAVMVVAVESSRGRMSDSEGVMAGASSLGVLKSVVVFSLFKASSNETFYSNRSQTVTDVRPHIEALQVVIEELKKKSQQAAWGACLHICPAQTSSLRRSPGSVDR